jgi:hypothetical protein
MRIKNKKNHFIIISVLVIILAIPTVVLLITRNSDDNREIVSSYMACGCGGCGGDQESETKYYSKSKGEETAYNQAVEDDKKTAQQDYCKLAGCGLCTKLVLVE